MSNSVCKGTWLYPKYLGLYSNGGLCPGGGVESQMAKKQKDPSTDEEARKQFLVKNHFLVSILKSVNNKLDYDQIWFIPGMMVVRYKKIYPLYHQVKGESPMITYINSEKKFEKFSRNS